MDFWNDELRFCSKCKKPCELSGEEKAACPHCGAVVWFYNYKMIPPPPPIPQPSNQNPWLSQLSILLLTCVCLSAMMIVLGIARDMLAVALSAIICGGFAVYAVIRHRAALILETRLAHSLQIEEYGQRQAERAKEATARYIALLRTGDERIQFYYDHIYVAAERERQSALRDRQAVASVERRIFAMAEKYIDDHRRWSTQKLKSDPETYNRRKSELNNAFEFVEKTGYQLPSRVRLEALERLKEDYKKKVYEQRIKDQQKELNRQAREEAKLIREQQQAIADAERQERELSDRLNQALARQQDAHSEEIRELERMLAEARAKSERAISMAQRTKVGHVYILSNIGSFGEGVYKIGMTRRLDPDDRVRELGDASVPFPFDVHAMIACQDAPSLEHALHHELTRHRVNRINLRKEFFRIDLDSIIDSVKRHHGQIEYIAEPEALQYRESLEIDPEEVVETERELEEMGINFEEAEEE